MFQRTNEECDLEGVDDFIEKPSQNCMPLELETGVNKIIVVLSKNPNAIMDKIANHPYIPATYLLEDLADKMKKQNSLDKLAVLFDKCLDKLVASCIFNLDDLKRCVADIQPEYFAQVMVCILTDDALSKRILEADNNPRETLNEIIEKYPNYKEQFLVCYNKHFTRAPGF